MKILNIKKTFLSKENILSFVGGIIFVIVFIWGYTYINNDWYEYRDDGVITMSVAKNLVDYGFMGVNVSGPIVEASSSPMQVFIYAIAYLFTGVDYADFAYWQTILATFLLGFIFIRFFSDKLIVALALTLFSAIGLTYMYSFFEWHASGMENAITHVLFLSTLYILYKFIKNKHINFSFIAIIFLATIARLDSVYHIAPLLIIFTIYWAFAYRSPKAFYFSFLVFTLWLLFQLWRYYYFGDIFPNTAYAQSISVRHNIYLLRIWDPQHIQNSFDLAKEIYRKQGVWLVFSALPLLYFFRPSKSRVFLILLFVSLVTTSLFNPFLFGHTRIDPVRTTTYLSLAIFLFISLLLYSSSIKKHSMILLVVLIPLSAIFYNYQKIMPYYLGFSTKEFNDNRKKFMSIAKDHNIDRPTISSADLGVTTWYKQVNNIDLGLLGSPIMAKLRWSPLITEYYLDYGLPDIIGVDGGWLKTYCKTVFTQDKFSTLYSQVGSQYNMNKVCASDERPPLIYWVRNDVKKDSNSSERKFLSLLQKNLNLETIENEINLCATNKKACRYIARTVYKFIPELRENGVFDHVYELFTKDADKALLRGWEDGQAHQLIIATIQKENEK